jgi:hypothetical protein
MPLLQGVGHPSLPRPDANNPNKKQKERNNYTVLKRPAITKSIFPQETAP